MHAQVFGRTSDRKRSGVGPGAGNTRAGVLVSPPRSLEAVSCSGRRSGSYSPAARNHCESPSARSNNPALFDGKNLHLVVGEDDAIGDRLPDQSARDEAMCESRRQTSQLEEKAARRLFPGDEELLLCPEGDREADIGAVRRARRYPQAPAVGFDN